MRPLKSVFWWITGLLFFWWLRRHAVLAAQAEHDAYAQERVHTRKRPGFAADQRATAILQRAQRKLRKAHVRINAKHVKKILEKS